MNIPPATNQMPQPDSPSVQKPAAPAAPGAGKDVTITLARQEWERVQKERDEYLDGWRRAKADYANFKKETEARREELVQFSAHTAIMEFLPLYDHLTLALSQVDEGLQRHAWVEGIRKIVQQFEKALSEQGVQRVEAEGKPFDPRLHEAVGMEAREDKEDHIILKVLKNGYTHHGRPIIPAKVVINSAPKNAGAPKVEHITNDQ